MLSKSKIRDIYDGAWNATPLAADENHEALHDAGLRAVEAAVRADQAVECNNARFELLRELAAAQAVIAAVQGFLDDERVEGDEHDDHVWLDDANSRLDDIRALTAQSPTDALQAVKAAAWDEGYGDDMECHVPRINPYRAEPSTPEQPEGEKP